MICMANFKRIPSSFSLSLQPTFVRPRARPRGKECNNA